MTRDVYHDRDGNELPCLQEPEDLSWAEVMWILLSIALLLWVLKMRRKP